MKAIEAFGLLTAFGSPGRTYEGQSSAKGAKLHSFRLEGSSKAARIMQQVCGFTTALTASAFLERHEHPPPSRSRRYPDSAQDIRLENGAKLQLLPSIIWEYPVLQSRKSRFATARTFR